MTEPDRVVIHTDRRPITDTQFDVMIAKARAAFVLGQQFTLELGSNLTIIVTADRLQIAEAHYAEQVRQATAEEVRRRTGAEFDEAYARHVQERLEEMRVRRGVLDDMEARLDRGDTL